MTPCIENYRKRFMAGSQNRAEGGLRHLFGFYRKNEPRKPLVSIITVVYNGRDTIEKTIKSVLNQTYGNIEYIIIDGGSKDGTLDIIRKYDNKIAYWVSEPDEGISDAFNKGIALSTGDIIGMINADDWYEPNAVSWAVERFNENGPDIVHGLVQYWNGRNMKELVTADHELLAYEMTLNHPTVFVRAGVYEKIGLFLTDFSYAMDYEWLLRAKVKGFRFSYIERKLANMSFNGSSDYHWRKAVKENWKARRLYGSCRFNSPYYIFQIGRGVIRRVLQRTGCDFIVNFFRSNFSVIKKRESAAKLRGSV